MLLRWLSAGGRQLCRPNPFLTGPDVCFKPGVRRPFWFFSFIDWPSLCGGDCVVPRGLMCVHASAYVIRHTSHVTRHTSHVTRHTSHVTRHTSHVTRHTSHVTRHTSHVTHHTSRVSVCLTCFLTLSYITQIALTNYYQVLIVLYTRTMLILLQCSYA